MSNRRFRRMSLRILVFVVIPMFAISFLLVRWRIDVANWQLTSLRELANMGILQEDEFLEPQAFSDDDWWDIFWGENLHAQQHLIMIDGTQESCDAAAVLNNVSSIAFQQIDPSMPVSRIRGLLQQHPKITSIHLAAGNPPASFYQEVARATKLKSFSANAAEMTEADLSLLVNHPLESLELWNCVGVTDVDCESISKMTQLKSLGLDATGVTDQGISLLGNLAQLESLDLENNKLNGDCLADLDGRQLTMLLLTNTAVTDDALVAVGEMKQLRDLQLSRTNITDQGLAHLRDLEHLNTLQISANRINDDGLAHLSGLTELISFWCDQTYCSPTAINVLADQLTQDRVDKSLYINWDAAGLIDVQTGDIAGYVPTYPDQLTTTHGVCWDPQRLFGSYFPLRIDSATPDESSDQPIRFAVVNDADRLSLIEAPAWRQLSEIAVPEGISLTQEFIVSNDQVFSFDTSRITAWSTNGQQQWSKRALKLPANHWMYDRGLHCCVDKIAINGEGQLEVFASANGELLVSNIRFSQQVVPQLATLTTPPVIAVAFDESNRAISVHRIAPPDASVGLEVRDFAAGKTLCQIHTNATLAVISPDAKFVATFDQSNRQIVIWDASTGERISKSKFDLRLGSMKFTPDSRYLVADVVYQVINPKYQ